MTFMQAAQRPLRRLADVSGRSSRKELWSFLLVLWVVVAILTVVLWTVAPELLVALVFPVVLVEYLLLWAVAVRRLHDTSRSGWMLLVALIPLLGFVILVVWFASAGDRGENPYGPGSVGA